MCPASIFFFDIWNLSVSKMVIIIPQISMVEFANFVGRQSIAMAFDASHNFRGVGSASCVAVVTCPSCIRNSMASRTTFSSSVQIWNGVLKCAW